MKFNVTQKILVGYVLGFILLLAFAALTLLNGKKLRRRQSRFPKKKYLV